MVDEGSPAPHTVTPGAPTPGAPDRYLDDLDEHQRAAVTSDALPLAVLAGPGAGKTRVLTRRIAWRVATGRAEAPRVLALTFTRKAAGELVSRLDRLGVRPGRSTGVTAGTIHAVALAQLRGRNLARGRAMPALLERKVRLLLPLVGGRGPAAIVAARELATEIEWAKARLVAPDAYVPAAARAGRTTERASAEIATLYARYEESKRTKRLVDFDDLLWWCGDACEQDEEFAGEQRWKFRHLFVDEFQDVSPAQLRVIRCWLGDRRDLTVVGDPDQAIFSFTGADPTGLTEFTKRFPGAAVVRLDHNHRSTPQIVAAGEALLADGGRPRPTRRALSASGPEPTVVAYDDDEEEARAVARTVRDLRTPSLGWSAFAILYRTNAQSAAFEAALAAAGIPTRVRADGRFLDRPEVRVALDRLRAAERAAPGATFADHLNELTDDGPPDTEDGSAAPDAAPEEHAGAVAHLAQEYLTMEPDRASVDGFMAWLTASLQGEEPGNGTDAVELSTFHRAKGLEFHTVFVTGLERGLVPISHADTPAAKAEERRLLYVALTRAEHRVILTWARRRAFGTRAMNRAPSPWLAPIEAVFDDEPAPSRAASASSGPERARSRLGRARAAGPGDTDGPEPDGPLLDALKEWRRVLAKASSVPAYVVFNDATLRAIATALPGSRDQLLDISGIGPVKVERYGEAVLELVGRHRRVVGVSPS
ncbi:MAG: ATP-dependent DNA helicase UvrD2 [Acidimicrobiia bacterium]